ncbi:hypothetical protein EON80_21455, partial [bacterium]
MPVFTVKTGIFVCFGLSDFMKTIKTHNLGFPRMGAKRELKFALESFWAGKTSA